MSLGASQSRGLGRICRGLRGLQLGGGWGQSFSSLFSLGCRGLEGLWDGTQEYVFFKFLSFATTQMILIHSPGQETPA